MAKAKVCQSTDAWQMFQIRFATVSVLCVADWETQLEILDCPTSPGTSCTKLVFLGSISARHFFNFFESCLRRSILHWLVSSHLTVRECNKMQDEICQTTKRFIAKRGRNPRQNTLDYRQNPSSAHAAGANISLRKRSVCTKALASSCVRMCLCERVCTYLFTSCHVHICCNG